MCQRLRAWTIRTPAGDDAAFEPEWIFCRVNGALIADFGGTSTWDGRPAAFRVTIHGGICLALEERLVEESKPVPVDEGRDLARERGLKHTSRSRGFEVDDMRRDRRSVRGRLLDNSLVYRLRHLAPPARDCHRRGS